MCNGEEKKESAFLPSFFLYQNLIVRLIFEFQTNIHATVLASFIGMTQMIKVTILTSFEL
jgi:phosphate starvation-inducible membrane PsiE